MNIQFILYFEQALLQLFLIIMGASYCAADLTIMKFHPKLPERWSWVLIIYSVAEYRV